jgi:hypothetical protein
MKRESHLFVLSLTGCLHVASLGSFCTGINAPPGGTTAVAHRPTSDQLRQPEASSPISH